MSAGLKALDAHIVLLQEVFVQVPSGLDVAGKLARDLDMYVAFAPARKKLRTYKDEAVLCHSGLAVLSRNPIVSFEAVRLPKDERDGERLGLLVSTTLNGRTVLIANVHLSHLKGEDTLRQNQLKALIARMEQLPSHDVVVLGGDLNLPAGHDVLARLSDFGFVCVKYDEDAAPATTLNAVDGTSPTNSVIDHIFIKNAQRDTGRVLARTALNQMEEKTGLYPSDHMAVIANLMLT